MCAETAAALGTSIVAYKTASHDVPRRHSARIWLLAVLAALPLPPARLAAQSAAGRHGEVGNPALNGSFLRPYANLWRVTVTLPNGVIRLLFVGPKGARWSWDMI